MPTSKFDQYDWHRRALRGENPQIVNDDPQCGWYKTRDFKRGNAWVPARIWLEQDINPETGALEDDEKIRCEINGVSVDPYRSWTRLCLNPINETAYRELKVAKPVTQRSTEPPKPTLPPRGARRRTLFDV